MNLMEATVTESNGGAEISVGDALMPLPQNVLAARPKLRDYFDRTVVLGIRPKDFEDAAIDTEAPAGQRIAAKVSNVEALGFEKIVYFELNAKPVISEDALDLDEDEGSLAEIKARDEVMIAARFDPATQVRIGDHCEVAVDMSHAHFFDLDTGEAIRS